MVGWGCGFVDFDADGDVELFQINGHTFPQVDEVDLGDPSGEGLLSAIASFGVAQPIPGTEHCVTPRGPIDVGKFTVDGFEDGTNDVLSLAGARRIIAKSANGGNGTINHHPAAH